MTKNYIFRMEYEVGYYIWEQNYYDFRRVNVGDIRATIYGNKAIMTLGG